MRSESDAAWQGIADAAAPTGRRARRLRETLRIGPFVVPAALVAWGLSLAAHATVVVVGIGLVRSARDLPPAIRFARGDGGGGAAGASAGEPGPAPLVFPRGPGPSGGPSWPTPALPLLEADDDDEPSFQAHGFPAAGDEFDAPGEAVIGLPATDLPAPRFGTAGPRGRDGGIKPGGASARGGAQVVGRALAGAGSAGDGSPGGGDAAAGRAGSTEGGGGRAGTPGGIADARLPAPRYPRESRRRGEEGTVVLEVDLAADGSVTAVRVRDDAGYPRLAAAAVDAVNRGRFPPAVRDGRPVPSTVRIPFRFTLKPSR